MTEIKIIKKENKYIIEVVGHANYSESGKDIVCAGVSILSYTLLNAIEEESDLLSCSILSSKTDEKDGYFYLEFSYHDFFSERLAIIVNTIELGYLSLAQSYPGYVKVNIDDVNLLN